MVLRAYLARAQVRARDFGARQLIQNEKLNLFCIYNVFISSKLAEMKAFEVLEKFCHKIAFSGKIPEIEAAHV